MKDSSPESLDVAYMPLTTRLSRFEGLKIEDIASLDTLPFRQHQYASGARIVGRGDRIQDIFLMISGWAARVRYTPSGLRQIIHILLPGDLLTGDVFMQWRLDHELVALTKTVVRSCKPHDLYSLFQRAPSLPSTLWWIAEQEDGMLREQIVRLGRRSAIERTSHLLLELHRRLLLVQQATDDAFILPVTQVEISDLLGLSVVHVNRTLKKLVDEGLIERKSSVIHLRDREKMADLCDFDLAHFHLDTQLSPVAAR